MPIAALAQDRPGGRLELVTLADDAPPLPGEIDVDVVHCAVCHSDVHLLDGDWGEVARPLVPGHEIVGRAGDRWVGIGWQAGSCGTCDECSSSREHLCTRGKVRTCMGRRGGFASRVRVDARFAFDLPERLPKEDAAPLLCAGLTTFSPLERLGVIARGERMRVGVVGLGGLGHLAVAFARAAGADVVAFDPDRDKRDLARSMGAADLVDARGPLPEGAVDLLLVTTHAALDWDAWMRVLRLEGTLCLVGIPTGPIAVSPDYLLDHQKRLTGSVIGSPATMRRMLDFAAAHRIVPVVEHLPMTRGAEAVARVREGRARLRVVLDADGPFAPSVR